MNFPKFWAQGRAGSFSSWSWSNTSLQEAQAAAAQAAQRLAALFMTSNGRPLDRYAYADRPLREPVLREFRSPAGDLTAVVTRNSYGCQILNTAQAMFVDVDLPEDPHGGALLAEKLKSGFGSLFGKKSAPQPDPAHAIVVRAEDWVARQPAWNWRIYRTAAGLRLLATHALFDPKDPACQLVFDAMNADPLYRQLCKTQECFRARLTPKPWRCQIPNPPGRWPYPDPGSERAFSTWDAEYQAATRMKATCNLITPGNGQIHPELQPLVTLHDEMTRATSQLPLA